MARLHNEFAIDRTIKGTDRDMRILAYLQQQDGIILEERLAEEADFQVFYSLTQLRKGIISWYDFKPNASVLEIGAGFGALTEQLCSKCANVTVTERSSFRAEAMLKRFENMENLDIYAGDVLSMEFPQKFDYVLLIGILERIGRGTSDRNVYSDYLKKIQRFLKEDGIVLIAVENRLGLRYFCGTVEPHTNKAFDGINGYANGTSGYSFSKKELEDIIELSGFSNCKFYYPLPDYKLPQLVYTDEYLPDKGLRERLIPYYKRNDTLIASERELYYDVIENDVFPFFANSYLAECSKMDNLGKVVYAAVSTDRGEERSFATTICKSETGTVDGKQDKDGIKQLIVYKTPLYKEGQKSADQLFSNIADLRQHGIPVVEHNKLEDGSLQLPFITWSTLSNYIKEVIQKDQNEFLDLVDKVYQYILQSSEQVSAESNMLLEKNIRNAQSEEERLRLENLDFGPVLKKAYMELIPLNCFYQKETKEFLYFDQEFVRENYPAKYVLFRAIHYIYCFTPNAEKYYPKKKLLEKYEMEDTWNIYLKEEQEFLDKVRNHKKYAQFYKWTKIDKKRISDNAKRLESEEETIANYKISDKMKKIWKVELEILDEVDKICKKHGLTYFLVAGSLLGAVRHKGFIPWDDDLDIGMPRKDYDRFLEAAVTELQEPLSIHYFATEKDIFWGGGARIQNGNTSAIQVKDLGHKGNQGIWIDILPLDVCTMDEGQFENKQKKIRHCHRLLYAKIYGKDYKRYADLSPMKWKGYILLSKLYSHDKLCDMLNNAMRLYTEEKSEDVAFFSGYYKHRRMAAKDFENTVTLNFEHRKVPVPVGYENYLFMFHGKDYMKYPPEEERKPKHRGIFDPDKSYPEYLNILSDMFDGVKGKKIILFGAGMMFEDYMKKYGNRYRPAFLVDNDKNKWGRSKMGIKICPPEEILSIPKEKRKVIICSFYYKQIQKQLEEMGIHDYKVYIQKLEWILKTEEQQNE